MVTELWESQASAASLPSGTAAVVVISGKVIATPPEEWDAPAGIDGDAETLSFEPGDELPKAIGEQLWATSEQKLAAFDEDGTRIDSPAPFEGATQRDAIASWRT